MMIRNALHAVIASLACVVGVYAQEPAAKLKHDEVVTCFSFAPTGSSKKMLASAADKRVHLWDYVAGKLIGEPRPTRHGEALSIAFSPDGKSLAVGCKEDILIWDVSDPTNIKQDEVLGLPAKTGHVSHLTFSGDGKRLFAATQDDGGGPILSWKRGEDRVRELCRIDEGAGNNVVGLFWSLGNDDELLLVVNDRSTPEFAKVVPVDVGGKVGKAKRVTDGRFSYQPASITGSDSRYQPLVGFAEQDEKGAGKLMVCNPGPISADQDGVGFYVWNCKKGRPEGEPLFVARPRGEDKGLVFGGAIAPDGKRIAAIAVFDKSWKMIIYDISGRRGEELGRVSPHGGDPFDRIAFSPDGQWIATSAIKGREVTLWEPRAVEKSRNR